MMLNHEDVSEFLKISPDGHEVGAGNWGGGGGAIGGVGIRDEKGAGGRGEKDNGLEMRNREY